MTVATAAAAEALEADYTLALVPPTSQTSWADRLDIDGAILMDPLERDPLIAVFNARRIPFVTIGVNPDASDGAAVWVDVDFDAGTQMVLDHLYQRGAQRTALISTMERRGYSLTARSAYERWCGERGVEPIVVELPEAGAEGAGYASTSNLLRTTPDVDAIWVPHDRFSAGALAATIESGRRVPDDMRIVTLEGTLARTCYPQLTALDGHSDENARLGVRMLIQRLKHPDEPLESKLVEAQLIPRASTGVAGDGWGRGGSGVVAGVGRTVDGPGGGGGREPGPPGEFLAGLCSTVLKSALDAGMTEHLGYETP